MTPAEGMITLAALGGPAGIAWIAIRGEAQAGRKLGVHLSALTALAVLTFACMVWSGIAVRPPTLTTLLIGPTMAVAIIAALGPTLLGWGVAEALLRTRYLNGFNFD